MGDHSIISAILLGIIEGITEFLPISSTGHLLIAEQWLGQRSDTFNIVIQAGAILAVTIIYWQRLLSLLIGWRNPENRSYAGKLILAFLVTAILGLVVKKLGFRLPESVTPIAWALIIGGLWMIAAEKIAARRPESSHVSWTVAVIVGLAQIVAGIFPGTSRSGATIFAAMIFGTRNRAAATEFAFLVGIPTMYAASAFELLSTIKDGGIGSEDWTSLGIAFVVSTITAFIAVKWLLNYIQNNRFTAFAIYRIIFGAALLGMVTVGWVS
ncbi:UDP pyrophosphate phosphatase [Pararhizobium polonicum]|uniref:Undecaprenyl-diphosphatase n=1 Tax=Pararhizobium polonicum TaxID=1612624 RepID=A0A1C7P6R4_9HYPH|nr:undecaprenyl-diphosphate phosphatase [Pararhizobium polonicum]OBZ96901.1 UDP pyrophosphate phosphatase [Pararhizobium polonicum]